MDSINDEGQKVHGCLDNSEIMAGCERKLAETKEGKTLKTRRFPLSFCRLVSLKRDYQYCCTYSVAST